MPSTLRETAKRDDTVASINVVSLWWQCSIGYKPPSLKILGFQFLAITHCINKTKVLDVYILPIFFFLVPILLSLVENLGHLTWVSNSSKKNSTTHLCQSVQYFHIFKQCLGFLMCTQMLTHAIAQGGCMATIRESALEVMTIITVSALEADKFQFHLSNFAFALKFYHSWQKWCDRVKLSWTDSFSYFEKPCWNSVKHMASAMLWVCLVLELLLIISKYF